MQRDDPGALRRIADALFRALDGLEPAGRPGSLDLSTCDALTPDADDEHLILQGKLCAQRLYLIGTRPSGYDQDTAFVLMTTLDLVIRGIAVERKADSEDLLRLNDAWQRLQDLTMTLEQLFAARDR